MRTTTRAILGMLIVITTGTAGSAEETKAPWWHFGMGKSAAESTPATSAAPTLTPSQTLAPPAAGNTASAAVDTDASWLKWPSWPKKDSSETTVTEVSPATTPLPRREFFGKSTRAAKPRNTWAQPPAETTAETPRVGTWKKVTDGTRSAWHKTVDFVTPGSPTENAVASNQTEDSWWRRMWSSDKEPEGPQTVTEWMAQDRLDP